jgi:hypothetical protein
MSDCCWRSWVRKALKRIRSDVEATHASVGMIHPRLDMIMERLEAMGAREDAADARLVELVDLVKNFLNGQTARIAELEGALANADAAKAAELTADSEGDAAVKEDLVAKLDALLPQPPVEEPTP